MTSISDKDSKAKNKHRCAMQLNAAMHEALSIKDSKAKNKHRYAMQLNAAMHEALSITENERGFKATLVGLFSLVITLTLLFIYLVISHD
jgi:hypothetical protein